MESVSHEEVVDVSLEVSILGVAVDNDLLCDIVDDVDTLYGVSLGIFHRGSSELIKLVLMYDFHSVNNGAADTVFFPVKESVFPVDGAHLEGILLIVDDFLHFAAVVNGAIREGNRHLQGNVDPEADGFSGRRIGRLGGILGRGGR